MTNINPPQKKNLFQFSMFFVNLYTLFDRENILNGRPTNDSS